MSLFDVFATALASFLACQVAIALYNVLTVPRLERFPSSFPFSGSVSVLIPARNEEKNLPDLLAALDRVACSRWEVLLLDDESTDASSSILEAWCARTKVPARRLQGTQLPPGWVGKNWACWQLAAEARGDVLLFVDADVRPGAHSITRTLAAMESTFADAVTAQPRHLFGSWAERAILPVVLYSSLGSLLPIRLLPRLPWRATVFANGQWLGFRKETYEAIGGHRAVRSEVLEDVALARLVKANDSHFVPLVAVEDLEVRMYRGGREVADGFGKNLYYLAGGSIGTTILVSALVLGSGVAPLLAPWYPALWPAFALWCALRVLENRLFHRSAREGLLYPLGAIGATGVLIYSTWLRFAKRAQWKGRPVPVSVPSSSLTSSP